MGAASTTGKIALYRIQEFYTTPEVSLWQGFVPDAKT
jgi:hypothetical protein